MQSRVVLEGKRILITGPAGRIAFPLAAELARNNEVWGIARFSDPASRRRVEETGTRTCTVDLADPDFGGLPSEFDYVLHLAAHMEGGLDYDRALRVNAEATGRLMSRFRSARAFLVVSTCGVYEPPSDPAHPIRESDPLGTSSQPYSPTYCISKIAEEAVARFAAREWSIPTTIARMNVAYGPTGGLPVQQLELLLADQAIPVTKGRKSFCNPIHEQDINAQVPLLLGVASTPATILNWAGDEVVDVETYCRYMGDLVGREPVFEERGDAIHTSCADNTRRRAQIGGCQVGWREGLRDVLAKLHPEIAQPS